MLTVYLLRHGETTYNADGNRYCGRIDAELTAKGISQAHRVAEALRGHPIDAVYASPLKRAYLTAEIASGSRLPVAKDDRLIELDFGTWEGKTREEFVTENPDLWRSWSESPDHTQAGGSGDTALDVVYRVDEFFQDMVRKHDGQHVLVVAHNGVNRLYLAWKLGMPLKYYRRIAQENSAITVIRFGDTEGFSLLKLNA